MSEHDLPDLPPDITALLGAARDVPAAPAPDRRRIAARLALTTGLAVPGATLAGTKLVAAAWIAKTAAVALVAVAATTAAVALVAPPARPRPAATPRAHVARTAPAPPPPPIVAAPEPPVVAAPSPPVVVAPAPVVTVSAPVDDTSLERELTLIASAHDALSRGATAEADDALGRHARLYPRGRLLPEREALRVQSLAASGQPDAARTARARFHRRFPSSMLGAAVDRAVDDLPSP